MLEHDTRVRISAALQRRQLRLRVSNLAVDVQRGQRDVGDHERLHDAHRWLLRAPWVNVEAARIIPQDSDPTNNFALSPVRFQVHRSRQSKKRGGTTQEMPGNAAATRTHAKGTHMLLKWL